MGREARFRKDLSMPGMLAEMRRCFERVADPVACRGLKLSECLMSGWRCSHACMPFRTVREHLAAIG